MTAGLVLFTAPSVSLEGKSLWIARSMPVPTREVLRAKQNMNLWLTLPCVLFCSLAGLFVFRPGPAAAAGLVLLPAAFTVLSGNIGLIANLRHPNLSWINETQAVKQGMSVLLSMLVNWGLALAAGLPYLLLLESRMDGGLYRRERS
jgi:ABC-2 type transport system permease protein